MKTMYSADTDDRVIEEAGRESPEGEIRIRVQPAVYRGGNYMAWQGVSWTLECANGAEAIGVRDALKEFFGAVQRVGPGPVRKALIGVEG